MKFSAAVFLVLILSTVIVAFAGEPDSARAYKDVAGKIIDEALANGQAYSRLRELCLQIGPRLSGSPAAAAAVEWSRQEMVKAGLDNVHLQPVMVPHWVRGEVEEASVVNSRQVGTVPLTVCALGGSVATPALGVVGKVIEVKTFEEVRRLGAGAKGAILFYNRPFDKTERNTFNAYVGAVDQRGRGAIEAARVGAVAVLVRSMTSRLDDIPHTGVMHYEDGVPQIPAAAISTVGANFLSELLQAEAGVRVNLRLSSHTLRDAPSANVIGEITGTELPDEVVLLGGHLDSWDKGQGAHDDGAGCVQALEALSLLKTLGLKPKRTIRAVMFINEENGTRGGKAYAAEIAANGPRHIAAIESDRGGFMPTGISVDADPGGPAFKSVAKWSFLLESIQAHRFEKGYSGVDIAALGDHGTLVMGLVVESQRYFDYHHSDNDTIDKVNERELELGAATLAVMSYVLANEGVGVEGR